jgi:hypothetical protein
VSPKQASKDYLAVIHAVEQTSPCCLMLRNQHPIVKVLLLILLLPQNAV